MEKTVNYSTPIEYKTIYREIPILILKRIKEELTIPCPFCGTGHLHGTVDGLRVAHCATGSKQFVTAPDGTVLHQKHGYIIVTVSELPK